MNKKMKLSYRAVLSLILSAVLFCMPAVAFSMNGNYAEEVRAEENAAGETENGREEAEGQTESPAEQETEDGTGETVSGNNLPEPVCTCDGKCGAYDYNRDCVVCAADYV